MQRSAQLGQRRPRLSVVEGLDDHAGDLTLAREQTVQCVTHSLSKPSSPRATDRPRRRRRRRDQTCYAVRRMHTPTATGLSHQVREDGSVWIQKSI